jgi:hypothetical protein
MTEALAVLNWEENGILGSQRKLGDFVAQMQSTVENNYNGFPLQLIDATVVAECVPFAETLDDIDNDKYAAAIRPVEFEDDLPVIDGVPIWERLDGEKIDYYKIFKEYRDMRYIDTSDLATRSMARLAEKLNVSGRLLSILARIYHWVIRVRAFDIYKAREIEHIKQREQEELESKHSKNAAELLDSAMKYIREHNNQLNPKVAMQMVELGMKYGRISVGLQGDKPGAQSSVAHQTNIAISQSNTTQSADQMLIAGNVGANANAGAGANQGRRGQLSGVERQLADNMKDQSNLVSILHVLNKSGALKVAVAGTEADKPTLDGDADTNTDNAENTDSTVEANYTVEKGDSND